MAHPGTAFAPSAALALTLSLAAVLGGCVTKSAARQQAQRAYLAGQQAGQQAVLERMQQGAGGPNVSFVGQVDNPVVPWWDGLTLSRAIINSGYYGPAAPRMILIRRGNQVIPIDPKLLAEGDDFAVQAGDIIELQQSPP